VIVVGELYGGEADPAPGAVVARLLAAEAEGEPFGRLVTYHNDGSEAVTMDLSPLAVTVLRGALDEIDRRGQEIA
jgi:hypothetical protein